MLMKLIRVSLFAVIAVALNAAADTPKAASQPVRTRLQRHVP
jgi:hypothetical protein